MITCSDSMFADDEPDKPDAKTETAEAGISCLRRDLEKGAVEEVNFKIDRVCSTNRYHSAEPLSSGEILTIEWVRR